MRRIVAPALHRLGLRAVTTGLVEALARHLAGHVLLFDPTRIGVVRILVALAVTERLRARIVRVAQVRGHGAGRQAAHRLQRGAEGGDDAVRLRREREVDHGVREVDAGFGKADELDGPRRGVGDEQRVRIGHTDVLGREDHEATAR